MRLLIDGDACPNREDIKRIALQYHLEMIVFIDYAHMIFDDDIEIVQCETGHDSVDMAIVNRTQGGDLVITQDYGLAGLILSKGAYVLHVSGKRITQDNIDGLLMSRYISAKERKKSNHLKGPAKRTQEVKDLFLRQLEIIIKEHQ